MKEITREMIKTFKLNKLGYDQMGYTFNNTKQLSYHHTKMKFGRQYMKCLIK